MPNPTTSIRPLDDAAAQARWRALWADASLRSPFSTLSYARTAADVLGLHASMHLVAADGRDEAGAIVLWRRRGPYRVVVLPPMTPYSALLLREVPEASHVHARRSALDALLESLAARYHHLRFFLPPPLADVRTAAWHGWTPQPFYTYRSTLQEGDLLGAWSSSTRRTYRKHHDAFHFAEVRSAEDPHALNAVVDLSMQSYDRQERGFPLERGTLVAWVAALQRANLIRLLTVTPHGGDAPEGGLAVLHDGATACYWLAGSRPGAAMTVLLGHALPRLRDDGITLFDFVGANTPSIAEFKRRFGPALVPYYHIRKTTRPELRLLSCLTGR